MELDHRNSPPGDAPDFVERCLIVIGVDRCNREHLGIFGGQRDQFIVLASSLRNVAAFRDQNTRESGRLLLGFRQLCLVGAQRGLAIPKVHVRIENSLRARHCRNSQK